MTEAEVLTMGREALLTALVVLGPVMATALIIGLSIAIFQAVTQLTEPTLTFVPKLIGVGLVIVLGGPLMMNKIVSFARDSFQQISQVLR